MNLTEIMEALRYLADDLDNSRKHECAGAQCSICYPAGKADRLRELKDHLTSIKGMLQ